MVFQTIISTYSKSSSFAKTLLQSHNSKKSNHGKNRAQLRSFAVFPLNNKTQNGVHMSVKKAPRAVTDEKDAMTAVSIRDKHNASVLVTIRRNMKGMNLVDHVFQSLVAKHECGIRLQLVSTATDPDTKEPKVSKESRIEWEQRAKIEGDKFTYKVNFVLEDDFGTPGAILVSNRCSKEFFLEDINFEGIINFDCKSWVQPFKAQPNKRIFFFNKACKPSDTPEGLKRLRKQELVQLRGDRLGIRKISDRIYDYDVYNDLGDPDKGLIRPILGGTKQYPNPRRCRTGRPPTQIDKNAECPTTGDMPMYVPRDENYEEMKIEAIKSQFLKGKLRNLIPLFISTISLGEGDILHGHSDIMSLYYQPPKNTKDGHPMSTSKTPFKGNLDKLFKFDPPKVLPSDNIFVSDDEFARQTIAGINPVNIEKLKIFPPRSKLDSSIYGPQVSLMKEEHLIAHLDGMSVQQAIDDNKLFILDYHDTFMPFLDGINTQNAKKAHATRTILFLTQSGTLRPIAIELSSAPGSPNGPRKQVLTPPVDDVTNWLWQLGKAHVSCNDVIVHQIINHWMRIHACFEPFIIAAHRQMSILHPIYKLLKPHMRYTLKTNAQARSNLIKAGGFFETELTSGQYGLQMASAAYADSWRFDLEGLPSDLIARGMAEPDPTQPNGLKLLIQDYPYANDGLLIWSAIERLVQTYVNHYYSDPNQIQLDKELNSWYAESIKAGHADHANASWWPKLDSPEDLTSILTTLIWLVSGHHASIHFGQYAYGAYVPNRPPVLNRLVPFEDDPDYAEFLADPEKYFISSLPNWTKTTKYVAMTDVLATHSPDEEYIWDRRDLSTWIEEQVIIDAFEAFYYEIQRIEEDIEQRNKDSNLRNRCGDGVVPYELLKPKPGLSLNRGGGIPNSVSM